MKQLGHWLCNIHVKGAFGVSTILALCLLIFTPEPSCADTQPQSATCARNQTPSTRTPGRDVVNAVFQNVNALLNAIGSTMYTGILGNDTFRHAVVAVSVMYIAIYGMMIMFNLVSHRPGEVLSRLFKLGIFFALLNPTPILGKASAWVLFDQYIGRFFMGGMNELIIAFTTAAYTGSSLPAAGDLTKLAPPTGWVTVLDTAAISAFFPAMDIVLQPLFIIAILGLLFLGTTGFMTAGVMLWALFDFMMLIIGIIVSYVRSVVGLTFLFGVGPIFLIFMLFARTRQITLGWVNQLISFALTPIMLFAFLSFYAVLLDVVMLNMFKGLDFCYTYFFSIPGTPIDVWWWRPAIQDPATGNMVIISGDWVNPDTTQRNPVLNPVNVIFFLLIAHLGKTFTQHIGDIASNISNGIGGAIESSSDVSSWIRKGAGNLKDGFKGPQKLPTPSDKPAKA